LVSLSLTASLSDFGAASDEVVAPQTLQDAPDLSGDPRAARTMSGLRVSLRSQEMIQLEAGFYVYVAPTPARAATDLHGPFASQVELEDWLMDNGIKLRNEQPPPAGSVRYFNEMTDDALDDKDYDPWACCPHWRNASWLPKSA
jgi:hypothetical protein